MLDRIKNALGLGDDDRGQYRDRPLGGTEQARHRKTIERKKERFKRSNRDFAGEREELERVPSPADEQAKRRSRSARDVRERADRLAEAESGDNRVPVGRDPAAWEDRLGDSPIAPGDDREPRPLAEENLPDLPHDRDRDESVAPARDEIEGNGTGADDDRDRDPDRDRERGRSR
jgi:hypothetical protein